MLNHTRFIPDEVFRRVLWCLIGYCAISSLTLPFIGKVWLGEVPLLALIQLPKVTVANWLRTHVVMEAIKYFDFSKGSFSPDYIMARPYALAIAYLIPLTVIVVTALRPFRSVDKPRVLAMATLLAAAAIDYVCTLIFADSRSLTIY